MTKEHISIDQINTSWKIVDVRNLLLTILILSSVFLLIRSFLLSPTPPDRPYIVENINDKSLLESLNWYAKNSMGSLKLDENRCILVKNSKQALCSEVILKRNPAKNLGYIDTIKNDKSNWPYIWKTIDHDSEVELEFALHNLNAIRIISQKERRTVLGTEVVVEVEFLRKELSAVSKLALQESELENLEKKNNEVFIASVSFLPNPYGYYLPIYPKP